MFCRIAAGEIPSVRVHEDADVIAFLDIAPMRPGHTVIVPKSHVETFEQLPAALANRILALGQQLAARMKALYKVERVAFFFTGTDIAHAHAHVVPIHEKMDITSARYLVSQKEISWSSEHLRTDAETLKRVRDELAFRAR
ncbi:MAG TPA: HIT family protein [Burkholderiales bacterium]|nr:HIT family protein [Burkholderiales bacterium]